MMYDEILGPDNVIPSMTDIQAHWISKEMDRAHIKLCDSISIESVYKITKWQSFVWAAISSGNKQFLAVALNGLMSCCRFSGSTNAWETFANECLDQLEQAQDIGVTPK